MTTRDIILAGFQISNEGWNLLTKIENAIRKLVIDAGHKEHIVFKQYDLASYSLDGIEDMCILFGGLAHKTKTNKNTTFYFPELKEILSNEETRNIANQHVKDIAPAIAKYLSSNSVKEEVKTHVEVPTGETIGTTGCDFCVTEQEAEYLKKILGILGGGKMVITKGDLRIEVEK